MVAFVNIKERGMIKVQQGFSFFELLAALLIAGILTVIAVPVYTGAIDRARVAHAISDIGGIHIEIQKFLLVENRGYPENLIELGMDELIDPWGNPYAYLVVEGLGNNGAVRKDKYMVPVNRHYDVYSMGSDGRTASPFTSTLGKDDVVLAGDGTYFGLAEDF